MSNQSYHHGDLKTELIRSGIKLLDQEGYEGFSLRKLAKACNVSQTAPYRHFKDKDELISAITKEALQAFYDSLEQTVVQNPGDPKNQLIEMGIAYVHFFVENPEYLRLLFLSNVRNKMEYNNCSIQEQIEADGAFLVYYKAMERYLLTYPEQPMGKEALLLYCWGLVHGIAVLIANRDFPIVGDYIQMVRSVMENCFNNDKLG